MRTSFEHATKMLESQLMTRSEAIKGGPDEKLSRRASYNGYTVYVRNREDVNESGALTNGAVKEALDKVQSDFVEGSRGSDPLRLASKASRIIRKYTGKSPKLANVANKHFGAVTKPRASGRAVVSKLKRKKQKAPVRAPVADYLKRPERTRDVVVNVATLVQEKRAIFQAGADAGNAEAAKALDVLNAAVDDLHSEGQDLRECLLKGGEGLAGIGTVLTYGAQAASYTKVASLTAALLASGSGGVPVALGIVFGGALIIDAVTGAKLAKSVCSFFFPPPVETFPPPVGDAAV